MAASPDGPAPKAHWRRYRVVYVTVLLTALATVALTALLVNIFEHKQEARQAFYRVVALDENTADPAIWGKNFPMQYRWIPAHGRPGTHALWRQRSDPAHPDGGRSAIDRRPITARR